MLYRFQKARRAYQVKTVPFRAVLGDASNNPYAEFGMYWVRRKANADPNDLATTGAPFRVRAGSAIIVPRGGRVVWVERGKDTHLTVTGYDHDDLVAAGIDPRGAQPNDPYREWIRFKQIQNFRALPLATTDGDSMKVQVRQLAYHDGDGNLVLYRGTNAAIHIDMTEYTPGDGLQRYAVLWLRTYNPFGLEPIQVTVSTPIDSIDDDLAFEDMQECADQADYDAIPIQSFRLANGQTTLSLDDTVDFDLRQFINMPHVFGFPNPVARHLILRGDRQQLFTGSLTVTGELTVEGELTGVELMPDAGGGSGGGSGTVTSVGLTMPSEFDVAGSPVTSSGTLAVSKANQSANQVYAGPASGSPAAPAFRALDDADVPNILTLTQINDTSANEQIKFVTTASAVNELTIANAATGGNPSISATGSDTNIGIDITPKGSDPAQVNGKFAVVSTSYPSHPLPTMTAAQQNSASAAEGDMVYNSTNKRVMYQNGTRFAQVGGIYRIADVRMSCASNDPWGEGTGANSVYIHPVESGMIGLKNAGGEYELYDASAATLAFSYNDNYSGNTTNASAVVTNTNTTYLSPRMTVSGSGIPGGTRIVSIDSATQFTMNNNATATASGVTLTIGLGTNINYDVFVYWNNGTLAIAYQLWAWTDNTNRATGISLVNGVYVKSDDTTHRYIGTIRINNSTRFDDNVSFRFVWNLYNQTARSLLVTDTTNSWNYTSNTIRQANANTANQVEIVVGLANISLIHLMLVALANTGAPLGAGIGEDSTTAMATGVVGMGTATASGALIASLDKLVPLGYHYYPWLERGAGAGVFYGDNNTPTFFQSGMTGFVYA